MIWGGILTKNEGDKKFSINQNLTVLFVLRNTLRIMIPTKRCARISIILKSVT